MKFVGFKIEDPHRYYSCKLDEDVTVFDICVDFDFGYVLNSESFCHKLVFTDVDYLKNKKDYYRGFEDGV